MTIFKVCVLFSSLSFFSYGISYFVFTKMKREFKRFNLEKLGLVVIIFQLLGAFGLIIGLYYYPLLLISSLGLGTLMLIGLGVRFRLKDSVLVSFPAFFFMILNFYIFISAINLH